jgi:hypothetical protein
MCRRRHEGEYPDAETPTLAEADAAEGIRIAAAIVAAARSLIESGELTPFR